MKKTKKEKSDSSRYNHHQKHEIERRKNVKKITISLMVVVVFVLCLRMYEKNFEIYSIYDDENYEMISITFIITYNIFVAI